MGKAKPATQSVDGQDAPEETKAVVVVRAFAGVPDGAVYPRTFAPGETLQGALAEVALCEGWAERR